jgi:hypothetical protein
LFLFSIDQWKLAGIVAAAGVFSKLIPMYLLYKRGDSPGDPKISVGILIFYFFFLWIQQTNVYEVYRQTMDATYKSKTFGDFIPILFGILPGARSAPIE